MPETADRGVGHDRRQIVDEFPVDPATKQHLLLAHSPDAARHALPAGLVAEEGGEVRGDAPEIGTLRDDQHGSRAQGRAGLAQALPVERQIDAIRAEEAGACASGQEGGEGASVLQPTAAFIALVMRTATEQDEWLNRCFDGLLVKPFDGTQVSDFLGAYFESLDLLDVYQNVFTPANYTGPEDGMDGFYRRLATACNESLDDAAAACYDQVILNLDEVEASQRLQRMLVKIAEKCTEIGI